MIEKRLQDEKSLNDYLNNRKNLKAFPPHGWSPPVPQKDRKFNPPPNWKEQDPNGISQHSPGAKLDQGKSRPALVFRGFSRALQAVVEIGTYGARKYTDDGWQHVPDGYNRYNDAQLRHQLKHDTGEELDPESNLYHLAHETWNSLAKLELFLREKEANEVRQGIGTSG